MLFYHRAQPLYVPGDRILPGAWGRLVLGTGPDHGRFYFEMVWETIRRAEFPDRPSRMEAAFVFRGLPSRQCLPPGAP